MGDAAGAQTGMSVLLKRGAIQTLCCANYIGFLGVLANTFACWALNFMCDL